MSLTHQESESKCLPGRVRFWGMRRSWRMRRGVSTVECALVAPLFLLLFFDMVEFGRLVMVQQLTTRADREDARQTILEGASAATAPEEKER